MKLALVEWSNRISSRNLLDARSLADYWTFPQSVIHDFPLKVACRRCIARTELCLQSAVWSIVGMYQLLSNLLPWQLLSVWPTLGQKSYRVDDSTLPFVSGDSSSRLQTIMRSDVICGGSNMADVMRRRILLGPSLILYIIKLSITKMGVERKRTLINNNKNAFVLTSFVPGTCSIGFFCYNLMYFHRINNLPYKRRMHSKKSYYLPRADLQRYKDNYNNNYNSSFFVCGRS